MSFTIFIVMFFMMIPLFMIMYGVRDNTVHTIIMIGMTLGIGMFIFGTIGDVVMDTSEMPDTKCLLHIAKQNGCEVNGTTVYGSTVGLVSEYSVGCKKGNYPWREAYNQTTYKFTADEINKCRESTGDGK